MAKAGMRRPDSGEPTKSSKKARMPKNTRPVPELQGKAKRAAKHARPT
jgi:hypothetical protein